MAQNLKLSQSTLTKPVMVYSFVSKTRL